MGTGKGSETAVAINARFSDGGRAVRAVGPTGALTMIGLSAARLSSAVPTVTAVAAAKLATRSVRETWWVLGRIGPRVGIVAER